MNAMEMSHGMEVTNIMIMKMMAMMTINSTLGWMIRNSTQTKKSMNYVDLARLLHPTD